jgi:pimeloyl-ACP methyl ester carboxylesterase
VAGALDAPAFTSASLTGAVAEYLLFCAKDGLAPGIEGWDEDGKAMAEPWGFAVTDITVPVLLMHGRQDQFVPFGHGEWLAARIPGVEARLLDHDGHLTLTESRIGEVHAWLLSRLLRAAAMRCLPRGRGGRGTG